MIPLSQPTPEGFYLSRVVKASDVVLRDQFLNMPLAPFGTVRVRYIRGAPEWLAPFRPSVHKDINSSKYRVRSCVAPCIVSNVTVPIAGIGFRTCKTIAAQLKWLDANPDWPTAMLYAIHAYYVLPSSRFYDHPLAVPVRALWTDEHTGICAGWKLVCRL